MSDSLFHFNDVVEISPERALVDLGKFEKHKLMDAALNPKDAGKRGLLVTFNLSSAGRRINNRIYTPKGQRDGAPTWTSPFPRPIIKNHDKKEDPFGRFASVEYRDIDNDALKFFKSASQFMAFKDALESDDPKRIYKALKDNRFLTNRKWPGIGELLAKAKITDEKAIEKFLDGRYMTFSAGSNTDRYVCSRCFTDWAVESPCEHKPGDVIDGELVVFISGTFIGSEGSVLTEPANDHSMVKCLEFADGLITNFPDSYKMTDTSTIYITDGLIDLPDFSLEDLEPQEQNMTINNNLDALIEALLPKLLDKLKESVSQETPVPPVVEVSVEQNDEVVKPVEEHVDTVEVITENTVEENVSTEQADEEIWKTLVDALYAGRTKLIESGLLKVGEADKLFEEQKDKYEADLNSLKTQFEDTKKDHEMALSLVDSLKMELSELKEKQKLDSENRTLQNEDKLKLDNERGSVQDPSESSSQALRDERQERGQLDKYEQNVVKKFLTIRDEKGEKVARRYISNLQQHDHLSKKFNIDMHITEENN